jgi:hypothetical protein
VDIRVSWPCTVPTTLVTSARTALTASTRFSTATMSRVPLDTRTPPPPPPSSTPSRAIQSDAVMGPPQNPSGYRPLTSSVLVVANVPKNSTIPVDRIKTNPPAVDANGDAVACAEALSGSSLAGR